MGGNHTVCYSATPAGFSTACAGLSPVAGPGTGAAGQQAEDVMEAAVRRQLCAVGTVSMGAHQGWGQDRGGLMGRGMRDCRPFLLTQVRLGLSSASASPPSPDPCVYWGAPE